MRQINDAAVDDPVEQSKQVIEDLKPSIVYRDIQFDNWINPNTRELASFTFRQEALGFYPVQELNVLLADAIKSFTEGSNGVKLGDLFKEEVRQQIPLPDSVDEDSVNTLMSENEALISAFLHLVKILPDFQLDIMMLSLGVEPGAREWAKAQLKRPVSKGGLSIDDGFDILSVFITQNVREIKRFFAEKGRDLVSQIQRELLDGDQSEGDQTETPDIEATAIPVPVPTPTPVPAPEPSTPGGTPSNTSSPVTQVSD